MKNLIIYTGLALVVLTNLDNKSVDYMSGVVASQESKKEVAATNSVKAIISTTGQIILTKEVKQIGYSKKHSSSRHFSNLDLVKSNYVLEPVEIVSTQNVAKTADQLIAEDNAITGNNISNETLILDFNIINSIVEDYVFVESTNIQKRKKTADQLIAEDNAITGNNISNETLILDFNLINIIVEDYVFVESTNIQKREKTADQLIAEDNEITGNNISNETQALDFDVINKLSKS
ncbi:hypothetical protein [Flavobacterium sp.]|jgi:hypothetical protein|uniref:hypothetical protein n=1 Tax=Flavobacterium sp. TaxID=239 RepID=UPI0037C0E445